MNWCIYLGKFYNKEVKLQLIKKKTPKGKNKGSLPKAYKKQWPKFE